VTLVAALQDDVGLRTDYGYDAFGNKTSVAVSEKWWPIIAVTVH
jgi:hypothetical protein